MIIKPPKPGLGFGFWDFGFWDLVWLGLGVAIVQIVGDTAPGNLAPTNNTGEKILCILDFTPERCLD